MVSARARVNLNLHDQLKRKDTLVLACRKDYATA